MSWARRGAQTTTASLSSSAPMLSLESMVWLSGSVGEEMGLNMWENIIEFGDDEFVESGS
ncbi:unnamed protein product [Brassica oleracea var. botrytis]